MDIFSDCGLEDGELGMIVRDIISFNFMHIKPNYLEEECKDNLKSELLIQKQGEDYKPLANIDS